MSSLATQIRELIARDQLESAASALENTDSLQTSLRDEAIVQHGELKLLEKERRRGIIKWQEYVDARRRIAYALLELVTEPDASIGAIPTKDMTALDPSSIPRSQRSPHVFISYNHRDGETALALKDALVLNGILVEFDADSISPGTRIEGFIVESIRKTDATICLISSQSLLSGWVTLETLIALSARQINGGRKFIACYLDDSFFDPAFRLRATESIDEKISELESLSLAHQERRLDTSDIDHERTRLYRVRNDLGTILAELRGSLCLDFREPARQDSIIRLVEVLRRDDGGRS